MNDQTESLYRAKVSRRTLFAGAAAISVPPLLAACSGDEGKSSSGSSGGQLTVALVAYKAESGVDPSTGREIEGVNELLKGFSSDTGINVRAIDINATGGNARQVKAQTLLLSGGADIIQYYTVWPFYQQGLLLDLNKYFEKDNWQDNYIPAIYTPPMERLMYPPWVSDPTTHVSAPGDLATLSTAYDNQLFEDFGVEPLSIVPTIDEVLEKAPKLTGKNPRTGEQCYGLYYDPRGQAHHMLYYLGHGVDFGIIDEGDPSKITFDSPEIKAGIKGMIDVAKYCPPGFEIGQGVENWGAESNNVAIRASVSPANMFPAVENNLEERFVVTEGIRDRNDHTFYVAAVEYAIAAKCKDPDAAWEVIKYLSGATGQEYGYDNYFSLPTWQDQDWVNAEETPYAEPFIATAQAGVNAFFPSFVFSTFSPWVAATVSQAVNGEKVDVDAGLADMQSKAEAWVAAGDAA